MTTENPLCHAEYERLETETREFNARDKKGRQFGARFVIQKVTYTLAPEGATWGYRREPGVAIQGCPQSLRGGKKYGAVQMDTNYPSLEAAHAARDKYFAQAEKRAMNHKDRRD